MFTKFSGLFIGSREAFSLGRTGFWLVFGISVYFWLARPAAEFPPSLENTLGFMLAYNLGGKAVGLAGKPRERSNHE